MDALVSWWHSLHHDLYSILTVVILHLYILHVVLFIYSAFFHLLQNHGGSNEKDSVNKSIMLLG